ncbi:MAG: YkgJ family cysteine cluster protein [Methanotrichaceae archaeon]|nr:YkgJ family cysteine cluster protein [Methanotrichaceae archaeon]
MKKEQDSAIVEREPFLQWFCSEIPENLFPQIAAQVLFRCENCRECCRGEGYAIVDEADLQEIARSLGISRSEARARFTNPDPEKNAGCRILKSIGPDRSCCFLDVQAKRCIIYSNRPRICRTFPMLNADVQCEEAICFYSDCKGTAQFVKMVQEKRCDLQIQREIESLTKQTEKLLALRILLFVWLCRMLGKIEEAEHICSITGISPPQEESAFKRDCLVYFLLTIKTDDLKEYQYEGE